MCGGRLISARRHAARGPAPTDPLVRELGRHGAALLLSHCPMALLKLAAFSRPSATASRSCKHRCGVCVERPSTVSTIPRAPPTGTFSPFTLSGDSSDSSGKSHDGRVATKDQVLFLYPTHLIMQCLTKGFPSTCCPLSDTRTQTRQPHSSCAPHNGTRQSQTQRVGT